MKIVVTDDLHPNRFDAKKPSVLLGLRHVPRIFRNSGVKTLFKAGLEHGF